MEYVFVLTASSQFITKMILMNTSAFNSMPLTGCLIHLSVYVVTYV
jgi:hypothetical protein